MKPETPESLAFLKDELEYRITRVDENKIYFRKRAYYAYISTTILAAISTIILGLNFEKFENHIRIIALCLSGVITVVNAYNTFFNHKDIWIANNEALNKLRELKFDIEFAEKEHHELTTPQISKFKTRYQTILYELNKTWKEKRQTHKDS